MLFTMEWFMLNGTPAPLPPSSLLPCYVSNQCVLIKDFWQEGEDWANEASHANFDHFLLLTPIFG